VTIAVGALALGPHAAWLIANDFAPFFYAVGAHGAAKFASALRSALGYLGGSVAYIAVPLAILFGTARPSRTAIKDMAWPTTPERRLAAAAFWAVLAVPALVAPLAGVHLVSLWSMSAWTLLPVMLLSSPLVAIGHRDAVRVVALAVVFPVVMVTAAPAVAFGIQSVGFAPGAAHSSVLVEPVERLWRETTGAPLKVFGGFEELTDGVAFYMRGHPRTTHVLDTPPTIADEELIAREGVALVCPFRDSECIKTISTRALRSAVGKRIEINISRRYLGVDGKSARYLVITIPPRAAMSD
jgi:hypothetical protein